MNRRFVAVSAVLAAMGILFFAIVNLMFCPSYLWFYYPAYVLLWFPLTALFRHRGGHAGFAMAGSAITVAFLAAVNLQNSPGHPWFLYAVCPVVWWPILIAAGKRVGRLWFALLCAAITVSYYVTLNILLSSGYPWALYPVFAVCWWPMTLFFARRGRWMGYAAAGALWISAFFVAVNLVSSPGVLWAVFPVFAVAWWPLSVYYFKYSKEKLLKH